ncbi:MAG: hypothetical protein UT33_C0017G0006 [Candidatus Peregrinibacteria bacterium GW2011_GWC2_39_14]|nr:MAG: hypothetical protein US92_C0007G0047 [Candidatus Peregrinibacteria bacterium GW2011_GWA2_38_36]KKR04735.1 MAG: hypothetical protein UT33_C0017G0006 [Candidatus Peregrinibacteria bacterium GW2011_GWC2_39_14]
MADKKLFMDKEDIKKMMNDKFTTKKDPCTVEEFKRSMKIASKLGIVELEDEESKKCPA